jgi:hypothetical protein
VVRLDADIFHDTRGDHFPIEELPGLDLENSGTPAPKVRRNAVLKEKIVQRIDNREDCQREFKLGGIGNNILLFLFEDKKRVAIDG